MNFLLKLHPKIWPRNPYSTRDPSSSSLPRSRGKLLEAEDNMNCQMQNITVTARDGRVSQVEQVFVRGSMIRFLILPDMLKNAPMFRPRAAGSRGISAGGGKSAMLRAQSK